MLIVTSEAAEDPASLDWMDEWRGPRVLIVLPDAKFRQGELRALEDRVIVIECLEKPVAVSRLLCEIMVRLDHLLKASNWPILFTRRTIQKAQLSDLERSGMAKPWDIRHDMQDQAAAPMLSLLLLGESVVSNPLCPVFFDSMRSQPPDDSAFVTLLGKHLVWG